MMRKMIWKHFVRRLLSILLLRMTLGSGLKEVAAHGRHIYNGQMLLGDVILPIWEQRNSMSFWSVP